MGTDFVLVVILIFLLIIRFHYNILTSIYHGEEYEMRASDTIMLVLVSGLMVVPLIFYTLILMVQLNTVKSWIKNFGRKVLRLVCSVWTSLIRGRRRRSP